MFFETLPEAPPDPVFGVNAAFLQDPRPHKVNLTVGIYKNEHLSSELIPSVERAMRETVGSAEYLPIDGFPAYIDQIGSLLFGKALWESHGGNIYGAQAVGGTGALRLGAELLRLIGVERIYISDPSWPNHRSLFERAGFSVEAHPWGDVDKLLAFLGAVPERSAICLHASCHNPTGCDPSLEEWAAIAKVVKRRKLLPFFDMAYQGFGSGVEEDAGAVRMFCSEGIECLVAYSCSKNFSLYCERVGGLFVHASDAGAKARIGSQIKRTVRALYSNPPAYGANIVARVLSRERAAWEADLAKMRGRLDAMRNALADRLDRPDLKRLKGMFVLLGLDAAAVQRLKTECGIYVLDRGRINLAGLNRENLEAVVSAVRRIS